MPRITTCAVAVVILLVLGIPAATMTMSPVQAHDTCPETIRLTAVIDRLEGEMAVVMLAEQQLQLDVPDEFIPAAADEGTILRIQITADLQQTEAIRRRQKQRLERLLRSSQ